MYTVVWQHTEGQSPAAGIVQEHRDSFPNEVKPE